MFKGFSELIQQAQKVKEEMGRIQDTLAKRTVEVSSGGGMVKITANGKQQILAITIDPEVLKMGDREMLQDLLTAGVNQAIQASQQLVSEEMSKVTGDLGPLSGLLRGIH